MKTHMSVLFSFPFFPTYSIQAPSLGDDATHSGQIILP
jgi:hypothetical protein